MNKIFKKSGCKHFFCPDLENVDIKICECILAPPGYAPSIGDFLFFITCSTISFARSIIIALSNSIFFFTLALDSNSRALRKSTHQLSTRKSPVVLVLRHFTMNESDLIIEFMKISKCDRADAVSCLIFHNYDLKNALSDYLGNNEQRCPKHHDLF